MKLRIKNTTITLKIIGFLQVIGGITGIGLMAYLMLHTGTINGTVLLILLIGLSLFIFSAHAGKRLLTDQDKSTAIILSAVNQAFQLCQFSLFGYGFSYSSGAELALGVQGLSFKFNIGVILSTFKMAIQSDDDSFIKINILAVVVIFVLIDIWSELNEKTDAQETVLQDFKR